MMDPRDLDEGQGLPLNLEAEQALLGILMYENAAHRQVHDLITLEDFSEPFHQRLYGAVVEKIVAGKLAEPTTLQTLDADPAYVEFGGLIYLLDLVDHAPPSNRIRDYAEQIADTAVRRRLIKMAAEAQSQARNPDVTGYAAVAMARAQLEDAERGAAPEDALFVNAWDAAQARMDRLELEVATGKPKGVQTGLSSIDKRLGGLLPGSVIVMAGRPGMGKTALLGNVLYGAALRNPSKLFAGFSLEMDTDQLNDRALSRLTVDEDQPVSFSDIAKVQPLTSFDLQALHRAKQSIPRNLWLRDRAGVSVEDVSRAVWAMKRRGDLAAKALDAKVVTDGKSNAEIKRAVLGDAAKDKSDAYVDAAFDLKTADIKTPDPLREVITDGVNVADALAQRDAAKEARLNRLNGITEAAA